MKTNYFYATIAGMILMSATAHNAAAQSAEQIDLGMAYTYPAGGVVPDGDLKVQFKPIMGSDFYTNPNYLWNNTVFTVYWAKTLGATALGNITSLSSITFSKIGAVQGSGNDYYQIIAASSSNVPQIIPMDGALDVVSLDITTAFATLPDFKLVNNSFVKDTIYGEASVNNILGEQFKTFNPANVPPMALPVSYLNFDVKVINNQSVQLNWATASETNNDYFDIQRTAKLTEPWITIGKRSGSGTTTERKAYDFIDREPMLGTQYYRIKQVDYDGKSALTKEQPATITPQNAGTTIKITPNPAQNFININITNAAATATLFIYDMYGKVIYTAEFENEVGSYVVQTIDIAQLSAGIYFIKTEIDGQPTENIRFVKN
jgi:hypothetical protein